MVPQVTLPRYVGITQATMPGDPRSPAVFRHAARACPPSIGSLSPPSQVFRVVFRTPYASFTPPSRSTRPGIQRGRKVEVWDAIEKPCRVCLMLCGGNGCGEVELTEARYLSLDVGSVPGSSSLFALESEALRRSSPECKHVTGRPLSIEEE